MSRYILTTVRVPSEGANDQQEDRAARMAFSTTGKYVQVRQAYSYVFVVNCFVRLTVRAFITCTALNGVSNQ